MAKNADLNKANRAKKDEFYTQLTDIEKEMRHYIHHLRIRWYSVIVMTLKPVTFGSSLN